MITVYTHSAILIYFNVNMHRIIASYGLNTDKVCSTDALRFLTVHSQACQLAGFVGDAS